MRYRPRFGSTKPTRADHITESGWLLEVQESFVDDIDSRHLLAPYKEPEVWWNRTTKCIMIALPTPTMRYIHLAPPRRNVFSKSEAGSKKEVLFRLTKFRVPGPLL
jgi:hypothetical protein